MTSRFADMAGNAASVTAGPSTPPLAISCTAFAGSRALARDVDAVRSILASVLNFGDAGDGASVYDRQQNIGVRMQPMQRDADGGLKIGNLASGQATRDEIGLYGQFRW